jgi:hypothetical protein
MEIDAWPSSSVTDLALIYFISINWPTVAAAGSHHERRVQRQPNRPYCLPLVPGTRADEAPASAPTSREELQQWRGSGLHF